MNNRSPYLPLSKQKARGPGAICHLIDQKKNSTLLTKRDKHRVLVPLFGIMYHLIHR